VRPAQDQELEHAARYLEAGAEGEGGAVMELEPEGVILAVGYAVVLILFMRHYNPTASRRRRLLVWYIPGLTLFCVMCWLFERLRTPVP
jgi:hypothetical protein